MQNAHPPRPLETRRNRSPNRIAISIRPSSSGDPMARMYKWGRKSPPDDLCEDQHDKSPDHREPPHGAGQGRRASRLGDRTDLRGHWHRGAQGGCCPAGATQSPPPRTAKPRHATGQGEVAKGAGGAGADRCQSFTRSLTSFGQLSGRFFRSLAANRLKSTDSVCATGRSAGFAPAKSDPHTQRLGNSLLGDRTDRHENSPASTCPLSV